MKALLTVVGICFSFFVAGESLVCQDCVNLNGTNCSGNLTTCAANSTSCENSIKEITQGGYTTVMAFKTCARSPQCHSYFFSETVGDNGLQMSKQCCTTDNCNVDPIVLSPRNNTPNGVICPFCYAENTTSCKPLETMKCTGLETKCAHFVGKVQRLDKAVAVAARYCITKEPCDGKWFSGPDGPAVEVLKFSCDDDNNDDDGKVDDGKDDDDNDDDGNVDDGKDDDDKDDDGNVDDGKDDDGNDDDGNVDDGKDDDGKDDDGKDDDDKNDDDKHSV